MNGDLGDTTQPLASGRIFNYQSTADGANNGEDGGGDERGSFISEPSMGSGSDDHQTDSYETYIHLVKGYMGAGCLSLPWAISQLGVVFGTLSIFAMSFWSSYNCWTVLRLKRHIVRTTNADDKMSETSSATTNTNITYPDVGDWAYGANFQSYVTICVCVQQLAICTVNISFVGENLLAVMDFLNIKFMATHGGVMTLAMPFILGISFIPTLKGLAPVMVAGGVTLMIAFAAVGAVVFLEFPDRPEDTPEINPPLVPLALCAILYSYEGINLILPVESAMKEPRHFKKVFVAAMSTVAAILSIFAVVCVLAFGYVSSGSITAFLLDVYRDDPLVIFWVMIGNTAVSLSVLLTYPLQLFPVLELLGPTMSKYLPFSQAAPVPQADDEEDDLSAFEPLPALPEHGFLSLDELPPMEHKYGEEHETDEKDGNDASSVNNSVDMSKSAISSMRSIMPQMVMPGDSPQLRAILVLMTYIVAVVIPNVQSLISLAGALAGSSTALLIPPALELAFIRHIEVDLTQDDAKDEEQRWVAGMAVQGNINTKWFFEKIKCWVLLILGTVFMLIGTYASLADIIKIYTNK